MPPSLRNAGRVGCISTAAPEQAASFDSWTSARADARLPSVEDVEAELAVRWVDKTSQSVSLLCVRASGVDAHDEGTAVAETLDTKTSPRLSREATEKKRIVVGLLVVGE